MNTVGLNNYLDTSFGFSSNLGIRGGDVSDDMLNMLGSQDLVKALEAGHLQGGDLTSPAQTNFGSLKFESLERSLKRLQYQQQHIKFWNLINKKEAYNTVEEYNQQLSYGSDAGGWLNEGELPDEQDNKYKRNAELVKYIGVTGSVTHQAMLVRSQSNAMTEQVQGKMLWVLKTVERGLFYGDTAFIEQNFNGVYAQHMNNPTFATLDEYMNSQLVIDLRGGQLSEDIIQDGETVIYHQFGVANTLIAPARVHSDLATKIYNKHRILQGSTATDVVIGNRITSFHGQYANIALESCLFASNIKPKMTASQATHSKAPTSPTAVGVTVQTGDTKSKFADGVGTHYYGVTSVNRFGESTLTKIDGGNPVTIANADDAVDLEFTATAGVYETEGFIVYRSELNPTGTFDNTMLYPIMFVPNTRNDAKRGSLVSGVDEGGAGIVKDRNRWLPGTEQAFLGEVTPEVFEFKQLLPMMKMDLAVISPAFRFMVLLYGTPILYNPFKLVRYINIGVSRKDKRLDDVLK